MPTNTWKSQERGIAADIGGERNGNRGSATADVETSWCAVECKYRKTLPTWLHSAVRQAVNAAGEGRLPVAVFQQKHQRRADSYVVMRWGDFVEWFGDPGGEEDAE